MRHFKILIICLLALSMIQGVQAKGISYIGGMMVHCGYSTGGELSVPGADAINIAGFSSGIGGRLLFNLNDHFRLGSEGYVSNINYGDRRSASIGWGGLAADYGAQFGKFRPTIGLTLGVGGYKNICVVEPAKGNDVVQDVIWNDYSLLVAVPYVGIEYSLTSKIRLYSRVDYITAPTTTHRDFVTGAKLHFGFMFSH